MRFLNNSRGVGYSRFSSLNFEGGEKNSRRGSR